MDQHNAFFFFGRDLWLGTRCSAPHLALPSGTPRTKPKPPSIGGSTRQTEKRCHWNAVDQRIRWRPGPVPSVRFALNGNVHAEVDVPMGRGEIGNHTGQAKRARFYAAHRQQPHAALPEGYTMPQGRPCQGVGGAVWLFKEPFADPEAAAHAHDTRRYRWRRGHPPRLLA